MKAELNQFSVICYEFALQRCYISYSSYRARHCTPEGVMFQLKLRAFSSEKPFKTSIPFDLKDHQKRLKPLTKRPWENAAN